MPGYVLLKIYSFFRNAKYTEATVTIWSVILSFLLVTMVNILDGVMFPDRVLNSWGLLITPVLLAVLCAFISVWAVKTKLFRWILQTVNHKSINHNIWDQIVDYDLGTEVAVKIKGENVLYVGGLLSIEENGLESWFTLSSHIKMNADDRTIIYDTSEESGARSVLAVNMRDVETIELFYDDSSTVYPGR